MQTKNLALSAGVVLPVHAFGEYFHLLETVAGVDIEFLRNGAVFASATSMEGGFFSRPEGGFQELRFTSATSQTIKIAVAKGSGGYQRTAGTINIVNIQATVITDVAPVAVGVVAVVVAAANAAARSLRFFNAGTADVYIGGSAVTVANGVIKLQPGALYIETEAAAAEWYGISGSAGQNVKVQVVS